MKQLFLAASFILVCSFAGSMAAAVVKTEDERIAKMAKTVLMDQNASNLLFLSRQDRQFLKKQNFVFGAKKALSIESSTSGFELLVEKDRFLIKIVDAEKQTLTINGRPLQLDKSQSLAENIERINKALQITSVLENLLLPRAYAGAPVAVWAAYILGTQAICVYRFRSAPELSGLCLAAPLGYPIKLLLSIGDLNAKEFNAMSLAEKDASFVLTDLNCPADPGGVLKLKVQSLSGQVIEIHEESFVNPENPLTQRKVSVTSETREKSFSAELDSKREPLPGASAKVPWMKDVAKYTEICQSKEQKIATINQANQNRVKLESYFSPTANPPSVPAVR